MWNMSYTFIYASVLLRISIIKFFSLHTPIDFFFLKGDNSEYQEIHDLILHPYDASLILSHILPSLPDTLMDPQFSNSLLCSHHYICMKWFISTILFLSS